MREMEIHDDAAAGDKTNKNNTNNNNHKTMDCDSDFANDQLEKCGKWLASIPRDDIKGLRHTVEFQEFLTAFERLGHAHLRVVVNNNHPADHNTVAMETKEEAPIDNSYHKNPQSSVSRTTTSTTNNTNTNNSESAKGEAVAMMMNSNEHHISEESNNNKNNNKNLSQSNSYIAKGFHENDDISEDFHPPAATEPPQDPKVDSPRSNRNSNSSRRHSFSTSSTTTTTSHNNNFLRFTDDILLRILEFLRCRCLIQTSLTCSRFHQLVIRSATQRTYDIASARQLGNVMQLLRAKEQIYYVDAGGTPEAGNSTTNNEDVPMLDASASASASDEGDNHTVVARRMGLPLHCSVPVPTLLPGRRVVVTNAGDPEYNGVYYCTDCNGNGFVFTKPRFSSQSHRMAHNNAHAHAHSQSQAQPPRVPIQHQLEGLVFDDETGPLRQNRVVGAIRRAGRLPLANHPNDHHHHNDEDRFQPRPQLQPRHHHPPRLQRLVEESFQSGLPLRCVISKAYSNHDMLWYMSKEIETPAEGASESNSNGSATGNGNVHGVTTSRRQRTYSFYAPLMLAGNALPELVQYPSQTSALSRQNESWRVLRGTMGMEAPTLEVLDEGV